MADTSGMTSSPSLDTLFGDAREVRYAKGELIIHPTDAVTSFYRIKSGFVKVYSLNNQGEEYIRLFYGSGEVFPLLWIAGDVPVHPNLFVSAVTEVTLLRTQYQRIRDKVRHDADMSYALLLQIVRQFIVYGERLDNLEYKYASERLAYRLLFLAGRFGEPQDGAILLPAITQQDIAATINTSRESANRELERLERKGLIGRQGRRIIINNAEELRRELHADVNLLAFHATL